MRNIVVSLSRVAKRRDNDAEDEEDNASRDNTDAAPTPEAVDKPAESMLPNYG